MNNTETQGTKKDGERRKKREMKGEYVDIKKYLEMEQMLIDLKERK